MSENSTSTNPADRVKKSKRSIMPLVWAFIAIISIALFTKLPRKIVQSVRALQKPKVIVQKADETALKIKLEQQLRGAWEKELQTRLSEQKFQIEETFAKQKANAIPSIDTTNESDSDLNKLSNGIIFKSEVLSTPSAAPASKERLNIESYLASYQLKIALPTAAKSLEEINLNTPRIAETLPKLGELMKNAEVSPWFEQLYANKIQRIRKNASTLNELLSKHNFYDLETILHFKSLSGKPVFLMQADMDVVSDGSDGDRLPTMPDEIVNSSYYQPYTSYGWKKLTSSPNPMIPGIQSRIGSLQAQLNATKTSAASKASIRERITELTKGLADLKSRSFLIAEYDPFIVIPVNVLSSDDANAPNIGDYCVVIYQGKAYPAIVGDGGPAFKVGEASLRLAKALNASATPNNRPVSDLKVCYLVFPKSADAERKAPDYKAWRERCLALLQDVGGLGPNVELHTWENTLPALPSAPTTTSPESAPISNPSAIPSKTTPPIATPSIQQSLQPR